MAALAEYPGLDHLSLEGLPLPLTMHLPVRLSDDELIAFSRRNRPYRIERNANGELEIMTPVGGDGSRWEARVIRELGSWADQNGGEFFSSAGGFSLPDGSMLSPDAAWVSAERWASLSKEQRQSFPPLCPDFIIEVRSASDSRPLLEAKMDRWIANGAQLAWMIDPNERRVQIYRPGKDALVLDRPDAIEAEDVVPGFRLVTSKLWDV